MKCDDCYTCVNLENYQSGFYCIIVSPKVQIVDGKCDSYEESLVSKKYRLKKEKENAKKQH